MMPPPSVFNFLAGLFAAAGINRLTSLAAGPLEVSTAAVAVDSAAWVLAAAATTWLAHVVEATNQQVAERVDHDFTAAERIAVRRSVQAAKATQRRAASASAVVLVVLSVALLPNLLR